MINKGIALAVLLLLPVISYAAVSPEMKSWGDGPARFWMTEQEQKEWRAITNDEDAQKFIDLFWAKRDPDLDKPGNPFRARFEALVKYADANVPEPATRGSLSDRGKFLILFGPPSRVINTGVAATATSVARPPTTGNEQRDFRELPTQTWTYEKAQLPSVTTRKFQLIFVDQYSGGRYQFDRRSTTTNMDPLIKKLVEQAIVHPDLKVAPAEAAEQTSQ